MPGDDGPLVRGDEGWLTLGELKSDPPLGGAVLGAGLLGVGVGVTMRGLGDGGAIGFGAALSLGCSGALRCHVPAPWPASRFSFTPAPLRLSMTCGGRVPGDPELPVAFSGVLGLGAGTALAPESPPRLSITCGGRVLGDPEFPVAFSGVLGLGAGIGFASGSPPLMPVF